MTGNGRSNGIMYYQERMSCQRRWRSVELCMLALVEVACTHASKTFTLYGKKLWRIAFLCERHIGVCAASEPSKKVCRVSKKELRYLSQRLRALRLADLPWFPKPSSEGGRELVLFASQWLLSVIVQGLPACTVEGVFLQICILCSDRSFL